MPENPFKEYKVYGPKIHQERRIVYLYRGDSGGRHITLSYAKYLLSMHLGRRLRSTEIVHHINGDSLDDRIENYEIITVKEHGERHNKQMRCVCKLPSCGKVFYRSPSRSRAYCSRDCVWEARRQGLH